jgi:hypothetical protein
VFCAGLGCDAVLELPCWLEESIGSPSSPAIKEFVRRRGIRPAIVNDVFPLRPEDAHPCTNVERGNFVLSRKLSTAMAISTCTVLAALLRNPISLQKQNAKLHDY